MKNEITLKSKFGVRTKIVETRLLIYIYIKKKKIGRKLQFLRSLSTPDLLARKVFTSGNDMKGPVCEALKESRLTAHFEFRPLTDGLSGKMAAN